MSIALSSFPSVTLLHNLCARGLQNFAGLPTQRDEQWKYTSLKFLDAFDLLAETTPAPTLPNHQNVVSLLAT